MVSIGANGRKIAYGIKHYNVDTFKDLEAYNPFSLTMGSTAFVIETSKHYMLDGNKQWKEISPFGSGGVIDGEVDGGEGDIPGNPEEIPDYDGGNIDGSDPS